MNSLFSLLNSLSRIPFGQWFMIARSAKKFERNYPYWERETQTTISLWQKQISSYIQKISYERTELSYRTKEGEAVKYVIENYQIGNVSNVSGIINVGKNISNTTIGVLNINNHYIESSLKISEIPEFVKLLSKKIHKAHYVDKELKQLSKSLDKGELESRTTIININIFINESKSTSHEIKEILSGKVDYTKLQEALGTANY